jgi:membrane-anchored protein YejM (alkaline phosphatase superfamily)
MIERGIRFVRIYSGGMANQRSWDGLNDIQGNYSQFSGETDTPMTGLLTDLEQRGLLKDTLVIWGREFGRLFLSPKSKETRSRPLYQLDGRRRNQR